MKKLSEINEENTTVCVNKNAQTHKTLVGIYNNMIDMNNIFHWIFVLCNLDLWFRSYSKYCGVPLNLWM